MSPTTTNQSMTTLIDHVTDTVYSIMSKSPYDSSHDHTHIQRVVKWARDLLECERKLKPEVVLDEDLAILAATLHDIGDSKYHCGSVTAESIMLQHGASADLASKVQLLVSNVSYANEKGNKEGIEKLVANHPELAIVQDADRIDALGMTGIGRMFAYSSRTGRTLDEMMALFQEVLLDREHTMKTERGREVAKERCERVRMFMRWYEEEQPDGSHGNIEK